jgi:hypothetical protein
MPDSSPIDVVSTTAVGAQARATDEDAVAIGQRRIEAGGGRRDIKGNAMKARQHRQAVGADLVGGVAIGGDAIRADDHRLHQPAGHQAAGHAIGGQAYVDAAGQQFPRGQARALQQGAGLVRIHRQGGAPAHGGDDGAQGGAVATSGEGAGMAMGEDTAMPWQQGGAVLGDGGAEGRVLAVDAAGLHQQAGNQFMRGQQASVGFRTGDHARHRH